MANVDRQIVIKFLTCMARIRLSELYLAKRYPEQEMKCPMHLSVGQELAAASLGLYAQKNDVFVGNYRSHGHYLAKGGDLYKLFSELLGRSDGCAGGFGGSMHMIDLASGFCGTSAIVGGGIPIAAGIALSLKKRKKNQVVICFFGDAALEEGIFFETVNFALLHKLPLIFVCENNELAVETSLSLRTVCPKPYLRIKSFGLASSIIKSGNIENILGKVADTFHFVRQRSEPFFIEFPVSRWCAHVGPQVHGPVDLWRQTPFSSEANHCMLSKTIRFLIKRRWLDMEQVGKIYQNLQMEIESTYEKARINFSLPHQNLFKKNLYASGLLSKLPVGGRARSNWEQIKKEPYSRVVNPF